VLEYQIVDIKSHVPILIQSYLQHPVLRKLLISTDDHKIDSDDEEKEKEEESVVHDETQSLNDSSYDIKSETEKNIDCSQVPSSSSSSDKARKNSFNLRRLRVKTLDGHGQRQQRLW